MENHIQDSINLDRSKTAIDISKKSFQLSAEYYSKNLALQEKKLDYDFQSNKKQLDLLQAKYELSRKLNFTNLLVKDFNIVMPTYSYKQGYRPKEWADFEIIFENRSNNDALQLKYFILGSTDPLHEIMYFNENQTKYPKCDFCVFFESSSYQNNNTVNQNEILKEKINLFLPNIEKADSLRSVYPLNFVIYYRYTDKIGDLMFEGARTFQIYLVRMERDSQKEFTQFFKRPNPSLSEVLSPCLVRCENFKYVFGRIGISEEKLNTLLRKEY